MGTWGLACLFFFIRILPISCLPSVASVLVWITKPFTRKDRRRLDENIHRVLGLPPESYFSSMFARQVMYLQALCALETLKAVFKPELLEVTGFEEFCALVAKAEKAGKGHIIVTAHLGSWELCAYFGAKAAKRPFQVLAKPSRSRVVTKALDKLRLRMGTKVLWTDKKSILREMLLAIKKAESIGFVMDQKPEGRKGPLVDFYGLPTEFVGGPASLAIKTGCAVISLFCVRTGPMEFRLLAKEIAAAEHGETDEVALTQRMAAVIEQAIRLYPEQWTWTYKRWRFKSV
jgi:KDO2-lipid IV(A) lauroyltransferase